MSLIIPHIAHVSFHTNCSKQRSLDLQPATVLSGDRPHEPAPPSASDGLSGAQTAAAAVNEVTNILSRIRERAMGPTSHGAGADERPFIQTRSTCFLVRPAPRCSRRQSRARRSLPSSFADGRVCWWLREARASRGGWGRHEAPQRVAVDRQSAHPPLGGRSPPLDIRSRAPPCSAPRIGSGAWPASAQHRVLRWRSPLLLAYARFHRWATATFAVGGGGEPVPTRPWRDLSRACVAVGRQASDDTDSLPVSASLSLPLRSANAELSLVHTAKALTPRHRSSPHGVARAAPMGLPRVALDDAPIFFH